jgi:hypothetical protein
VVNQTMQPTRVSLWLRPPATSSALCVRNDPGTLTGDPQRV